MVGVELEIAAHAVEVGGAQGLDQRLVVGEVAAHRAHRAVDQQRRVIALAGVERGDAAVRFLEVATKRWFAGFSRSGLHCAVLLTPSADSPTGGRMSWLKLKAGPNIGLALQTAWSYCLMKLMPMPPEEEVDGVGLGRLDLGDLRGVVLLPELGIDLLDDLAVVEPLEPGQRVLSGRVVRRQDEGGLVARVRDVLAIAS